MAAGAVTASYVACSCSLAVHISSVLREVYASYRPISRPSSSSCMGDASSRHALDARSEFLRGSDDVKHGCNSPRCVSRTSTSDGRAVYCRGGSRPKYVWGGGWPLFFSLFPYDTIRDAILTCAQKLTRVGLIYCTETDN